MCRTNGAQTSFNTQQEKAAFQNVHEGVTLLYNKPIAVEAVAVSTQSSTYAKLCRAQ